MTSRLPEVLAADEEIEVRIKQALAKPIAMSQNTSGTAIALNNIANVLAEMGEANRRNPRPSRAWPGNLE